MRPTLTLGFADFWPSFKPDDNYFHTLLSERYRVELSDDPELLIYSAFGRDHRKYRCTRVFYTGENLRPSFGIADFALTFDRLQRPEHFRFPNFLLYAPERLVRAEDYDPRAILAGKTRFCNFLYSNTACARRIRFLERLSRYRAVDSGGRVLNNLDLTVVDRDAFRRQYKFTIAFENEARPGYTTEKIVDAMLADTLPIYWGDPEIDRDFNCASFLNAADYASDDALIEAIVELDQNDDLYLARMAQPWLPDNRFPQSWSRQAVAAFFDQIVGSTQRPAATKPLRSVFYRLDDVFSAARRAKRVARRHAGARAIRGFQRRKDQAAPPESGAVLRNE